MTNAGITVDLDAVSQTGDGADALSRRIAAAGFPSIFVHFDESVALCWRLTLRDDDLIYPGRRFAIMDDGNVIAA